MDVDLQQLKQLDARVQCLIFGFVKDAQLSFSDGSRYWNVSDLIVYIILAYYQDIEYFAHFNKEKWTISNNDLTIIKTENSYASCYGNIVIPFESKGIHHWKFTFYQSFNGCGAIGIDESVHKWLDRDFHCASRKTIHYGFRGDTGCKYDRSGSSIGYINTGYLKGDTVNMILDLNSKTLSYSVNDAKPTKAFDIEPSQLGYCMAVYMYGNTNGLTLLSYNYTTTIK
eukprot:40901_1